MHPPSLVILSLNASDTKAKSVVWVGKGIVYDTGGLSIKTKTGMPGMKRDMGGAAAVLAGGYVCMYVCKYGWMDGCVYMYT